MALAASTCVRRRGPRAPSRRGYRHAAVLPAAPSGVEVLAAVKQAREARGRTQEWDARLEASCMAVHAYLWRRGHGEKWAGKDGSARFACSLAQLVAGLAPIMGWTGSREQLVKQHRASVRRWLDWLQAAGLITYTGQSDDEGWRWRTIVELLPVPGLPAELLEAAADRRRGWTARETRRDRRGRRRNLTAILRRARLSRAQRRARAVARRKAVAEHGERLAVRAMIAESLACATMVDGETVVTCGPSLRGETKSRTATSSISKEPLLTSTFTRTRALPAVAPQPTVTDSRTARLTEREGSAASQVAAEASAPQPPLNSDVEQLDAAVWQIARQAADRWHSRDLAEWQPLADQITARTVDLEDWPAGRPCPRWRLQETWTAIAWGVEYAAAGAASRLAMWPPSGPHGDRLARALHRYERHADVRPAGWPASGVGALVRYLRHQHSEPGIRPRCLSYDVKAFDRWTKQLAAHARVRDLDAWTDRARARAQRRASRALQAAGEINERLPESAWLKPAGEFVPLPFPAAGPVRKQRRLADRDRRLLAGQAPLSAGTLRSAWAYEDKWLR
jgi:hypothetical protein